MEGAARVEPAYTGGFKGVFPGVCLPIFLGSVDQTIVATALPAVARDMNNLTNVSWVVISYLLFQTVSAPIYGRLSDLFGRRRMLMICLGVLVGASGLCAISTSLGMLIFARALQGCGGGGLQTLAQTIIGEVTPARERGKYQGYLAAVYGASSTLGPVIGGWLAQEYTWRAVFWFQFPVGALAFLMALRLPKLAGTGSGGMRFDYRGTALFVIASITFLLGITQLGHGQNADYTMIFGLIAVAIIAGGLFVWAERRASSPLMPLSILKQPAIWRTCLVITGYSAAQIGAVNFVPFYLQAVMGFDGKSSGVLLLALSTANVGSAVVAGGRMARTGRVTQWSSVGMPVTALATLGLGLTALLPPTSPLVGWVVGGLLLLLGIGGGAVLPMATMVVQVAVERKSLGSANSTIIFSRAIGSAIGTAVVTTTLLATLSWIDPDASRFMMRLIDEGPSLLATVSAGQQAAEHLHIVHAFAAAFAVLAVFPALACWQIMRIPIRKVA